MDKIKSFSEYVLYREDCDKGLGDIDAMPNEDGRNKNRNPGFE